MILSNILVDIFVNPTWQDYIIIGLVGITVYIVSEVFDYHHYQVTITGTIMVFLLFIREVAHLNYFQILVDHLRSYTFENIWLPIVIGVYLLGLLYNNRNGLPTLKFVGIMVFTGIIILRLL